MSGTAAFQNALPDATSTLGLAGLEQPVEVYRDRLGIPHMRASSTHDAFFAQGFVHAQDRLFQMDYDRRRAAGTAAAWAGAGLLDADILMRRLRLDESARADYASFNNETRALMDAYADGVNAFIHTTTALPAEYALLDVKPEAWEPWQAGAIFKVRHVLMGVWGTEFGAHVAPGTRSGGRHQTGHAWQRGWHRHRAARCGIPRRPSTMLIC